MEYLNIKINGEQIKTAMLEYIIPIDRANMPENGFTCDEQIYEYYDEKSLSFVAKIFEEYGGMDE